MAEPRPMGTLLYAEHPDATVGRELRDELAASCLVVASAGSARVLA